LIRNTRMPLLIQASQSLQQLLAPLLAGPGGWRQALALQLHHQGLPPGVQHLPVLARRALHLHYELGHPALKVLQHVI
jgi:hypothetical protein